MRSKARRRPVVLQPAITASTPSVDTSSRGEKGEIEASASRDRSEQQVAAAGADAAAEHDELRVEHRGDGGDRMRKAACLDAHHAIGVGIAVTRGVEDRRDRGRRAHAVARVRARRSRPTRRGSRRRPSPRSRDARLRPRASRSRRRNAISPARPAAPRRSAPSTKTPVATPVPDREQHEVLAVLSDALDVLADRRHVDVVLEDDRRDQCVADGRDHLGALPAGELRRERQVIRARTEHARAFRRPPG